MTKTIVWFVILALAGGGAWYWWNNRAAPTEGVAYRTAPVVRTDLVSTISASGTIVPEDVIDVGTQVNGPISSFGTDTDGKPVDYRSTVTEGALLAKIDETVYAADVAAGEAQLAQANAQVRVANANLSQAEAKGRQAERDWARAQKLGASKALSQADYDAAQSAHEQADSGVAVAQASIAQAEASVRSADASLARSRRSLSYCTIKSPVTGVIIDRRVEIGQTVVSSLNAQSLFLIAKDLARMQVLVQVNEADIGHVKPGAPVTFTCDAFPGDGFRGEVRKVRLNATMTQNVVTYTVEIVTENASLKLLPYLTANVKFIVDQRKDVLAVPNAALRWTPPAGATAAAPPAEPSDGAGAERTERDGRLEHSNGGGSRPSSRAERAGGRGGKSSRGAVWVLEAGQLRQVAVKVGLTDGTMTEVSGDDLDAGDLVVVGEQAAGAGAGREDAANPFAPPMRGRRR